jgi:hypothetical protein
MTRTHPQVPRATVYFADGVVVNRETIIIPSGFLEFPDAAMSRIMMKFSDGWASHDVLNDFIVSVTYHPPANTCYALGRNGVIESFGRRGQPFDFEHIEFVKSKLSGVPRLGNMTRISSIANRVYAIGWGGQIYVLERDRWVPHTAGLSGKIGSLNFEAIAGTAEDDIYIVGMRGIVAHFDGLKWAVLDSPTNSHLSSVYCEASGQVYVGGNNGELYIGSRNRWRFIGSDSFRENLWSLQEFKGSLYAAFGNTGILRYDGSGLEQLNMGLGRNPTTHRLHANDGVLWSFGAYDLSSFDGSRWTLISCPENE